MVVGDMRRLAIVREKPNKERDLYMVPSAFDEEDNQPIIKTDVDESDGTQKVDWCSPAWEQSYTWEETELVCQIAAPTPSL